MKDGERYIPALDNEKIQKNVELSIPLASNHFKVIVIGLLIFIIFNLIIIEGIPNWQLITHQIKAYGLQLVLANSDKKWCQINTRVRKIKIQMIQTIINPQKALKTFVFEREDTQQSVIIDYEVDLQSNFANLSYLFSLYCPLTHNKVSVYDPLIARFSSLSKIGAENGHLPLSYLQPTFILIRYARRTDYGSESDSMDSGLQGESRSESRGERKDGRSKQRTIAQVIEMVKKWRDLHLHGHKTIKRRLNLQDAARIVGISKKSLDDYYCQLRLGQLYGFDFFGSLQEKMGVLRSFVKNYRPEKESKRRQNQKHPKNLRIINQFDFETKQLRPVEMELDEEYVEAGEEEITDKGLNRQISAGEMVEEGAFEKEVSIQNDSNQFRDLFNLQNQFFRGFELVLDDQSDPYFDIDRDFRKKDFALDSDSFLLFE